MKNVKPSDQIDVGTKALSMFSTNNVFIPDEKQKKFCEDCLNFYVTAVQYLQKNLPFEVNLLKYAQYIHPEKRNAAAASNAISNLAIKITAVLGNCLSVVFKIEEPVVDQIRHQWHLYQNEVLNQIQMMRPAHQANSIHIGHVPRSNVHLTPTQIKNNDSRELMSFGVE